MGTVFFVLWQFERAVSTQEEGGRASRKRRVLLCKYHCWYVSAQSLVSVRNEQLLIVLATGLLTGACTNPIWVVKTRMLERGANHPSAYKSMSFGLRHVYETRGLKGLWAGFIPSSLGVLHGAVQFSIYENMKKRRGHQVGGQDRLSNWEYVYMSGGSKLLAGAITYPYQPIRARMQQYNAAQQYTGLLDVLQKTYKNEGLLAFYKGYAVYYFTN
jgi:primary-amine oxidase